MEGFDLGQTSNPSLAWKVSKVSKVSEVLKVSKVFFLVLNNISGPDFINFTCFYRTRSNTASDYNSTRT